jgi:hypothetical protein
MWGAEFGCERLSCRHSTLPAGGVKTAIRLLDGLIAAGVALTVNPHVANSGQFPCRYANGIGCWRQSPWRHDSTRNGNRGAYENFGSERCCKSEACHTLAPRTVGLPNCLWTLADYRSGSAQVLIVAAIARKNSLGFSHFRRQQAREPAFFSSMTATRQPD